MSRVDAKVSFLQQKVPDGDMLVVKAGGNSEMLTAEHPLFLLVVKVGQLTLGNQ